jgi:hypothetical protein
MSEFPLDGFAPSTRADWETAFSKEWKGVPEPAYAHKTADGLPIRPFYTPEDLHALPPGAEAFQRSAQVRASSYSHTLQMLGPGDAKDLNAQALEALQDGATSLLFYLHGHEDAAVLLAGIQADIVPIHLVVESEEMGFLQGWLEGWRTLGMDPDRWQGSWNTASAGAALKAQADLLPAGVRLAVNAGLQRLAHLKDPNALPAVPALAWAIQEWDRLVATLGANFIPRLWVHWTVGNRLLEEWAAIRALRAAWA